MRRSVWASLLVAALLDLRLLALRQLRSAPSAARRRLRRSQARANESADPTAKHVATYSGEPARFIHALPSFFTHSGVAVLDQMAANGALP